MPNSIQLINMPLKITEIIDDFPPYLSHFF